MSSVQIIDELIECFDVSIEQKIELQNLIQSKEIQLRHYILRYDLGIITLPEHANLDSLEYDECALNGAIQLAIEKCVRNYDLREAVYSKRNKNYNQRNTIYELRFKLAALQKDPHESFSADWFDLDGINDHQSQQEQISDNINQAVRDRQIAIDNLEIRFDLGIITQDCNRVSAESVSSLEEMKQCSNELRYKAEALAQRTILENFELNEMCEELDDECNALMKEIQELVMFSFVICIINVF